MRFWVWIAFALLYGICETLFGNWGTVYLHQQRALPDATANLALAVFWAAVTLGRLLVAVIAARVPPLVIFRALPVLIAIALMCVAFSSSAAFGVAAFALAGLACSACLPLSIGTASSETPRFVETVSGWMVASYMMGYGIGRNLLRLTQPALLVRAFALISTMRDSCWPRLARPPQGLAIDRPEHGGTLDRIGIGKTPMPYRAQRSMASLETEQHMRIIVVARATSCRSVVHRLQAPPDGLTLVLPT